MSDSLDAPYDRAHDDSLSPRRSAPVSHDAIHIQPLEAERDAERPSADSLTEPIKAGWLTKRGYKLGCVPVWKRRYCILKGQYIFKFEGPTSSQPKGVPIPILGASFSSPLVDPSPSAAANGHAVTTVLSTLRKEYVFGAESLEELESWIASVSHARALAIKQELGHAPLSSSDEYANRSGALLMQKRMEREVDEAEISRRGQYEYQP